LSDRANDTANLNRWDSENRSTPTASNSESSRAYHEFDNSVTTHGVSYFTLVGVPIAPITAQLQTTQLGTYEQFGVGIAGQIINTGWLGYVRADYRTGHKIEGYSVNGGIRYQFMPDLAAPSGLITKAKRVKALGPVVAAYNWTGFYIGANVGEADGTDRWSWTGLPLDYKPHFAGVIGGVQAGYDWQIGRWVLGLDGTADWSNAHGTSSCTPNIFLFSCENDLNFLGTATGRVGYAFWDRAIIYAKAGLAVGSSTDRVICNTGINPIFGVGLLPGCPAISQRNTRAGYTAGFGTEFALAKNWTVNSETNYFNLGRQTFNVFPPLTPPATIRQNGFVTTVALNYRF